MTNETANLHRSTCDEIAPLLERQIARESLDKEEQRIVEHHLSTCKDCEDFLTWTAGWPVFSDQVSEKAMQSLIAQATDRHFDAKRTRRWAVAVGLAGVLAAAAIALILVLPRMVEDRTDALAVEGCVPTPAVAVAAGVKIAHCTQNAINTVVTDEEIRVTIYNGAVGLSIDPDRSHKQVVSVMTPFGEARVKGTVFTVHIEPNEARVEVLRGTVSVLGRDEPDVGIDVREGNGASMVEQRVVSLSNPQQNIFYPILFPPAAGENFHRDRERAGAPAETSVENLASEDAGERRTVPEMREMDTDDSSTRGRIVPLDALWAESRNCLISQDWLCASIQYRRILKQHSGRRESLAALISLARIELRYLGKPEAALRHFSAYRQQYPNGPLMEEAVWGMVESCRQLGNKQLELEALRTFTKEYPKSSLTGRALRRIKEIE